MNEPSAAPFPPGWHPDPSDPRQQRWWDGTAWTVHTHVAAPGGPTPPAGNGNGNARWWLIGGGSAAVVILVVVVAAVALTRGDRYPSQWDPRVTDLVAFAEKERDPSFDHPVEIVMVPEADFAESLRVDETAFDEEDLDAVSTSEAQLRAFGLIDGATDLIDTNNDIQSAGTLAYYSPEEEKIYVRGTELTPAVETTLVHELVHTLQDQRFDLTEIVEDSPDPIAVRSIVEGDATRVENAYVAQLAQTERDAIFHEQDSGYDDSGLDAMPDALVAATAAPYALGESAVDVLFARGGNAEVNQAFLKPPTADVQILDPQRLADDAPEPVEAPASPDGTTEVSSDDTYGALFWDIVLARRVGIQSALAFADTWDGDASVTYETPEGRTCTTSAVRLTDAVAARAGVSVLEAWLAAGTQPVDAQTFARIRSDDAEVAELGVCDPGTESTAPGEDNAQPVIGLATIRLRYQSDALSAGLSMKSARCFANAAIAPLEASDLADGADPAGWQQKAELGIRSAQSVCR